MTALRLNSNHFLKLATAALRMVAGFSIHWRAVCEPLNGPL
jgi:hypothetical protein